MVTEHDPEETISIPKSKNEGCNERGHVKSYFPKCLKKIHKCKNDWQTKQLYVSPKKRKSAAAAGRVSADSGFES